VETGAGCRNQYGTGADAVAAPSGTSDEVAAADRVGAADRADAPGDPRPGFPPGRPLDRSPGTEDRPTDWSLLVLVAALVGLAAAAAKSYSLLRNRSAR
jgi:hypothetical protein